MLTFAHFRFKQFLKHKAAELGADVMDVNEAYTSKTVRGKRINDEKWLEGNVIFGAIYMEGQHVHIVKPGLVYLPEVYARLFGEPEEG